MRQAIVPAEPGRRHGAAGKHPVAQDVAVQRAHHQFDPDIAPVVRDYLKCILDFLTLTGCFHHQLHQPPVGQIADAVGVFLCKAGLVQQPVGAIGIAEMSAIGVLFVISIAFFIGCMFVDPIVVILVLVPVFAPVVKSVGLDPVLVGTIITLQVAIGSATPPFGCDIFTAIAVFKRPYAEVVRGTPPFILMLLGVSVALIFFPQIALFLRDLAFAK